MAETLEAQGWVESIEHNYAWVRTQRQSACGGCHGEATCGTGSLSKLFSATTHPLLKLSNEVGAKPGDQVLLELESSHFIKQAFLAYGLPLVGLFVGALLLSFVVSNPQDWQVASGALLGMVSAWLWVRFNHQPQQPIIKQVIRSSE